MALTMLRFLKREALKLQERVYTWEQRVENGQNMVDMLRGDLVSLNARIKEIEEEEKALEIGAIDPNNYTPSS